jgi:hypothetical protein
MPSKLRIIPFNFDEVASAPCIGINVPDISFVSAKAVYDADTPSTCFDLVGCGGRFTVTNGQLATSLIYSRDLAGVPLPRDGKKEIRIGPGFVELRIALHQYASVLTKKAYPRVEI